MRLQPKMMSLGLGAGAMYLLDPEHGKRRRALVRDQIAHLGNVTGKAAGSRARALRNRTRGMTHGLASRLRRDDADDVVLHDRVRSKLGRVCSHPAAIEVTCVDGCCTLSGVILASERDLVLATASKVRGVVEVVDQLETRDGGETFGPQGANDGANDGAREVGAFGPARAGAPRAVAGVVGGTLVVAGAALLLRGLRQRGGDAAHRVPRLGGRDAEHDAGEAAVGFPDGESLMVDGAEPLAGPLQTDGLGSH